MERRNCILSQAAHFTSDGDSRLPSRWLFLHLYEDMAVLPQTSCGPVLPLPVLEEGISSGCHLLTGTQVPFTKNHHTLDRSSDSPSSPGFGKRKFRICASSPSLGDIYFLFSSPKATIERIEEYEKENSALTLCWKCCGLELI